MVADALPALELALEAEDLLALLAQLALGAAGGQLHAGLGGPQLVDCLEQLVGLVAQPADVVLQLGVLAVAALDLALQVLDRAVDVADRARRLGPLVLLRLELGLELRLLAFTSYGDG